jgi:hypothetical protein
MGYLARSDEAEARPAVIVLQEWWGLNEHIKEVARRFAGEGFVALAPDLYHVASFARGETLIWAANLTHRGLFIKEGLDKRRHVRRSRRSRKVRYRKARFKNRSRPKGWLPPSLVSRIDNVYNWGKKLMNLSPINGIEVETARFDTLQLMNPEI